MTRSESGARSDPRCSPSAPATHPLPAGARRDAGAARAGAVARPGGLGMTAVADAHDLAGAVGGPQRCGQDREESEPPQRMTEAFPPTAMGGSGPHCRIAIPVMRGLWIAAPARPAIWARRPACRCDGCGAAGDRSTLVQDASRAPQPPALPGRHRHAQVFVGHLAGRHPGFQQRAGRFHPWRRAGGDRCLGTSERTRNRT